MFDVGILGLKNIITINVCPLPKKNCVKRPKTQIQSPSEYMYSQRPISGRFRLSNRPFYQKTEMDNRTTVF